MPIEIEGLDRDIAFIEQEVEGVIRDMARETGELIIAFSPILTGFFNFNWNDSTGGPIQTVRGTRPDVDRRVFGDPSFTVQNTWQIEDGDIVFANAVEYAEFLDANPGASGQAPQGITDPVSSLVDSRFRRVEI